MKKRLTILAFIAAFVVIGLALGRGVSLSTKAGTIKVEAAPLPTSSPEAETFGSGSPIAAGSDAHAEVNFPAISKKSKDASPNAEHSDAKYVTHGNASPIAVGSGASAKTTTGEKQ